jgi:hypothetical protein
MIERAADGPSDAAQEIHATPVALSSRRFAPAGFSWVFCRAARKLLTVPFKSMFLGAADAPGEASLAAQRGSNFLCM